MEEEEEEFKSSCYSYSYHWHLADSVGDAKLFGYLYSISTPHPNYHRHQANTPVPDLPFPIHGTSPGVPSLPLPTLSYSLHAHFVMYALVPALSIGVIHLTRGHSLDSGPGPPNWGDPSR